MKVIYRWLKEFVDVPEEAEEVSARLLWLGMEPKSVEREQWICPDDAIFLPIRSISLSNGKFRVRIDSSEEVITSAQPVKEGDLVAYSPSQKRLLKLCDLFPGAVPESPFIYQNFEAKGQEVKNWEEEILDWVIDVETPSNRADLLSHIGIARELSAVYRNPLRLPTTEKLPSAKPKDLQVQILVPELCRRYAALIAQFRLLPSPIVAQRRLLMCGIRPITGIVDISNYVMLESGQPTHTFDAEKIGGNTIRVRTANYGETITTLDEVEKILQPEDLVIADDTKPIALAGIMGSIESAIGPFSAQTVIESAYFTPYAVRRTSRSHNLRTESSHRFERDVDPEGIPSALFRIAFFLKQWNIGTPQPFIVDEYPNPFESKRIFFFPSDCERILGKQVPSSEQKQILKHLGFTVQDGNADHWQTTVPAFRRDVELLEDIVEDIARISGYWEIPEQLTPVLVRTGRPDDIFIFTQSLSEAILPCGFTEVKTLSLLQDNLGFLDPLSLGQPIRVLNPLTEEMSLLRYSLIPGLIQVASLNQRRHFFSRPLFEIGKVFSEVNGSVQESVRLALLQPEKEWKQNWEKGLKEQWSDFYVWKGKLESILESLGLQRVTWKSAEVTKQCFHPYRQVLAVKNSHLLGIAGEIHPTLLKRWDIPYRIWAAEFDVLAISSHFIPSISVQEIKPFPIVQRDLSVLCPVGIVFQEVEECIRKSAGPYLIYLSLFDRYQGKEIPKGKESLTFTLLFQHPERTFTEEELQAQINQIEEALLEKGVIRR